MAEEQTRPAEEKEEKQIILTTGSLLDLLIELRIEPEDAKIETLGIVVANAQPLLSSAGSVRAIIEDVLAGVKRKAKKKDANAVYDIQIGSYAKDNFCFYAYGTAIKIKKD